MPLPLRPRDGDDPPGQLRAVAVRFRALALRSALGAELSPDDRMLIWEAFSDLADSCEAAARRIAEGDGDRDADVQ